MVLAVLVPVVPPRFPESRLSECFQVLWLLTQRYQWHGFKFADSGRTPDCDRVPCVHSNAI